MLKLGKLATQALDRAESLKGLKSTTKQDTTINPIGVNITSPVATRPSAGVGGGYTEDEKRVLTTTSRINGIDYLPFLSYDLKTERFNYSSNFNDPNGLLKLSAKQREKFSRWARPAELFNNPVIIMNTIDSYSIKQTLVSDCSFVASLAIAANYEKKFNKKLIRNIIFPQDKRGEPMINPFGKYMVLLLLNGVRRKVNRI